MKIYLAGPDVFRPDAQAWADNARLLCKHYGFEAMTPMDHNESDPHKIFETNLALITMSQVVCANLDPFRGHEPDSGTAFEVGFGLALGKKVMGYVSSRQTTVERIGAQVDANGYKVEDFGLPLNLMLAIPCQVVAGGLEECLKTIRAKPASQ